MKRYLLHLTSLCLTLSAWAQGGSDLEITHLDWNELRIDTVLPVYTEVVPLETDYTRNDYSVTLDYPEYLPLTKAEAQVAARYDSLICDSIVPETHLGISRKRGLLDISFVPIIRRTDGYAKLISAQITIHSTSKPERHAVPAKEGRYAAHSKLSSGRWVKISITDDGMYRLTRPTLQSMGFNPDKVHLYGYGGHLQEEKITANSHYDDLVEVPLYYSKSQDAWLFYGKGLIHWAGNTRVRNHYARNACYFLTEEGATSHIETEASATGSIMHTYTSFPDNVLYEEEDYAWFAGGRNLYGRDNYKDRNTHTYTLNTTNSVGKEVLTIAFTASNNTTIKMTPTVNGQQLKNMSLNPIAKYIYATETIQDYDLSTMGSPAQWNVKLTSEQNKNARLDYLSMSYERLLKPSFGFVAFHQTGTGISKFNIQGTDLCVMRIGTPKDPMPKLIAGTQEGGNYSVVVSDATRDYVAFSPSYPFPEPTFMEYVANQDLHSIMAADMVIIVPTSGKLTAQAKRLADAHKTYDGLNVVVVNAAQLYNEFSSGTPDATAYRRFMKMLYDRAATIETAPKYLLLMGDCAWDNRMICSAWKKQDPNDYLLCFESENSFSDTKSYVMEDYFALLDDTEGGNLLSDKPDIGVGRFPVINEKQAKIMVDKTIAYISNENAGAWKNLVYFLGDDGDNNEHLVFADNVAERVKQIYPELEIRKVMWDNYVRVSTTNSNTYPEASRILRKQMKEGAMVMNYTGHAANYGLSHEFVLVTEDFESSKSTNLPLWVTCACDVMPFDGQGKNIGETAVLNPEGGALAFYGTTRTVYANQNSHMNRYFMQYLFGRTDGKRNRLGDAIRLAKNSIIASGVESIYKENKLQYALLGDPAITIGNPLEQVSLDSITLDTPDGTRYTSRQTFNIKAGQHIFLKGHIKDAVGDTLSNYQGVLTTRMYDNEELNTCKNNADADKAFTFKDRNTLLYESQSSIKDGIFTLDFIVPIDINYSDDYGRFVFYAINDDKRIEANGYSENFTLGGIVDNTGDDSNGPQIYAYLNNESFQNGGVVNNTPYFVAHLQDMSGLNACGNGIGHNLELCVDGRADYTYVLNDYYVREFGDFTRGTIYFSIPTLPAGHHQLTFRAWDVLNNTNTITLDFEVDPELAPNFFNLMASQNPASTSTTFLIHHDLPGSDCTFTVEVFDFTGRCVWSTTEVGSSPTGVYNVGWNLQNGNGSRVPAGIYLYRCLLQSGESKKMSKTQKLIVTNNK